MCSSFNTPRRACENSVMALGQFSLETRRSFNPHVGLVKVTDVHVDDSDGLGHLVVSIPASGL